MIVKRIVRTEDGQIEATLMLTGEQAAFLINAGLAVLVQRGAVELLDMSEEEYREQQMQSANDATTEVVEAEESTTVSPSPSEQMLPQDTQEDTQKELDKKQLAFLAAVDIKNLPKV